MNSKRRQLIAGLSLAGAGVLLNACRTTSNSSGGATNENKNEGPAPGEAAQIEVTATEDLMREHGILRRALLVYQETAIRLRQDAGSVPPEALEKAANLFRVFGEDYHEKMLEEVYILPIVRKSPGTAVAVAASTTAVQRSARSQGRSARRWPLCSTTCQPGTLPRS